MTILEILSTAAAYHKKSVADLTVNGINLGLLALNQARSSAEDIHDFSFQRKLLTLSVNSATGGSLEDAVIKGTSTTVDLKTIIEIGQFDQYDNFRPLEWTTVEEGQERTRVENPRWGIRYPTDAQALSFPQGQPRIVLRGNMVEIWPKTDEASFNLTIGIEAYVYDSDWVGASHVAVTGTTGVTDFNTTYYLNGSFGSYGLWLNINPLDIASGPTGGILRALWNDSSNWAMSIANDIGTGASGNIAYETSTAATPAGLTLTTITGIEITGEPIVSAITGDLVGTSSFWFTKGATYLIWSAICDLNKYFKTFVPRTEGNLAEPQVIADKELQTLIASDIYKAEGFRRHGR